MTDIGDVDWCCRHHCCRRLGRTSHLGSTDPHRDHATANAIADHARQHDRVGSRLRSLVGTAPIATYANISSLTVLLTDHPLLLQLSDAIPVTTTPPVTTDPPVVTTPPVDTTTSPTALPVTTTTPTSDPAITTASANGPAATATPAIGVYRFFDTAHGTHFYTDSVTERATILSTRADLVAEGIGFYEPPSA